MHFPPARPIPCSSPIFTLRLPQWPHHTCPTQRGCHVLWWRPCAPERLHLRRAQNLARQGHRPVPPSRVQTARRQRASSHDPDETLPYPTVSLHGTPNSVDPHCIKWCPDGTLRQAIPNPHIAPARRTRAPCPGKALRHILNLTAPGLRTRAQATTPAWRRTLPILACTQNPARVLKRGALPDNRV